MALEEAKGSSVASSCPRDILRGDGADGAFTKGVAERERLCCSDSATSMAATGGFAANGSLSTTHALRLLWLLLLERLALALPRFTLAATADRSDCSDGPDVDDG